MAITSGFFNSVNGDRRYKADFFAEYFSSFIANGVFPNPSTGMQVIANGNMTVSIRSGKAWIKGYYVNNDADYLLSLSVADGVLKRIDRIVLRLDFSSRQITPAVKKGTAASSPTAPSLQRDADAYELVLADVLITNGAISISQANITDTRLNTALCGIVHGVVDQVDTTNIFNQYKTWFNEFSIAKQSEFNTWKSVQELDYTNWSAGKKNEFDDWFTSIKDIFSGDVAGNLLSKITQIENELAAHKADYTTHTGFAVATGTANSYIATLTPALSTYKEGVSLRLKINVANTGASTINVNGLGAKAIKKQNGNAAVIGTLKAGSVYTLAYDGTAFILQGEGASGNAIASDLLSGKTASADAGDIVGTIPNKVGSATIITPRTSDIVIPKGYFGGDINDGKILGDLNLIADNILSGKSIFGVNGNLSPKRIATGTATSSAQYDLTVSLSFKPSIVIFTAYNGTSYYNLGVLFDYKTFYTLLNPSYKAINGFSVQQTWGGNPSQLGLLNEETSYVLDNGFKIKVPYFSTRYDFKAIEY